MEALANDVLESLPDGCLILDSEFRLLYVNQRAVALLRPMHKTSESMIGRSLWDEFPLSVDNEDGIAYRAAMAEQQPRSFELYYPPLNSYFAVRAFPTPERLTVLFEDISARKGAELAIAAEKRLLSRLLSNATLPELLDAIAREVESHSKAGMMCSVLLMEQGTNRMRHGAAPSLADAYNNAIDGLEIGSGVGSCGTAAFERRTVSVEEIATHPYWAAFASLAATHGLGACTSMPIMSSSAEVLGTIAMYYPRPHRPDEVDVKLTEVARDIAALAIERERSQASMRRAEQDRETLLEGERYARNAAERANRLKDEFLATLSHELRTPLGAIMGWAQLLQASPPTPEQLAKGLEVIERNARMQAQLIEDLLDMSRITSGSLRMDVQPVNPSTVIAAAMETVRTAAEAKGIRLESVLDPLAAPVSGDPVRLQQVVWNLVANAIKFTPRGGRVQVVLRRVNSHIEISVADSGAGIAPEFLPHVFDRFRQANATTTRTHGGLGLGLAIVKSLVELHGGTVRVESEGLGKGSTFFVDLPISAAMRTALESQHVHPAAGGSHSFQMMDLTGLSILVVDDQPDGCEMVGRLLETCGATLRLASSAQNALRAFSERTPDILLSDIGMPEMDGYELIRRIRALPANEGGSVPAIAMTAFARSEDRARALRSGFQAHVAKPCDPSELVAAVASVAGRTA